MKWKNVNLFEMWKSNNNNNNDHDDGSNNVKFDISEQKVLGWLQNKKTQRTESRNQCILKYYVNSTISSCDLFLSPQLKMNIVNKISLSVALTATF